MPILGENESVEKTIVREGHSKMKKIVLALTCVFLPKPLRSTIESNFLPMSAQMVL